MSTIPRIPSAIAGQAPSLGSVLAHAPDIARAFAEFYAEFWQGGLVDARLKELVRIRVARITDCGY